MSPASKIKRVSIKKMKSALKSKTERISVALKRRLEDSFEQPMETAEESMNPLCKDYLELIEKLKEKCKMTTSNQVKVNAISLMPTNWSRLKICEELQVSEYLVRTTKDLMKRQGVLPYMPKRKELKKLSEETVTLIQDFYQSDENSRILPGKKDCASVRIDGRKESKQKRLILCNLRELYLHFKVLKPDVKVGVSTFCSLRPKWCILAGSSGTHSVCVCIYHQNKINA